MRYVIEVKRSDGEWFMFFTRSSPDGFKTRRGAEQLLATWKEDAVNGEVRILELTEAELDTRMAEARRRSIAALVNLGLDRSNAEAMFGVRP